MADNTNHKIEVTLWQEKAANEGQALAEVAKNNEVCLLAIRGAKVSEFNKAKSLSANSSSLFIYNPECEKSLMLTEWYGTFSSKPDFRDSLISVSSSNFDTVPANQRKSLDEIYTEFDITRQKLLEGGKKPEKDIASVCSIVANTRATIIMLKHYDSVTNTLIELWYPSCKNCHKKLQSPSNGESVCNKCNLLMPIDQAPLRYMVSVNVSDHSSSKWMSAFDEIAMKALFDDKKPENLKMAKETNPAEYDQIIDRAAFRTFVLKVKVQLKEDVKNSVFKPQYTIIKQDKVNFETESKLLIDVIKNIDSATFANVPQQVDNEMINYEQQ